MLSETNLYEREQVVRFAVHCLLVGLQHGLDHVHRVAVNCVVAPVHFHGGGGLHLLQVKLREEVGSFLCRARKTITAPPVALVHQKSFASRGDLYFLRIFSHLQIKESEPTVAALPERSYETSNF